MTTTRKGHGAIACDSSKNAGVEDRHRSPLVKPSASASEETQAGLRTDAHERKTAFDSNIDGAFPPRGAVAGLSLSSMDANTVAGAVRESHPLPEHL